MHSEKFGQTISVSFALMYTQACDKFLYLKPYSLISRNKKTGQETVQNTGSRPASVILAECSQLRKMNYWFVVSYNCKPHFLVTDFAISEKVRVKAGVEILLQLRLHFNIGRNIRNSFVEAPGTGDWLVLYVSLKIFIFVS